MNKQNWKNKLYWFQDGKSKEKKSYIPDFLKTLPENTFDEVTSIDTLFSVAKKLSSQYVAWVINKAGFTQALAQTVSVDIENTFLGFIGEFFFLEVFLPNRRCYTQKILNSKALDQKVFYNVKPFEGQDFGEDGYCIDERGVKCAIQVKFWNPDTAEKLVMENFNALNSQALDEGHIDLKDTNNEIFCWLGDIKHVTSWLRANKTLTNKVVFIGRDCINQTLGPDKTFWAVYFKDKLKELINL